MPLLCIAGPENAHASEYEQPKGTHSQRYRTTAPSNLGIEIAELSPAAIITILFALSFLV